MNNREVSKLLLEYPGDEQMHFDIDFQWLEDIQKWAQNAYQFLKQYNEPLPCFETRFCTCRETLDEYLKPSNVSPYPIIRMLAYSFAEELDKCNDNKQLMEHYNVTRPSELIREMSEHIERLQKNRE